jgi:hypothetical protein
MEFMACINCEYPVQQLLYHKLKATTNTSNFASQYPRKRLGLSSQHGYLEQTISENIFLKKIGLMSL